MRHSLGRYATLTVGGINIFNTDSGRFGLIGGPGVYQPENALYSDANFAAQAYNKGLPENIGESFGQPSAQITASVGLKI